MRKDPLVNGQCYHIFSRSIAKYIIFNNSSDFERLIELIDLYRFNDFFYKYSGFLELNAFFRLKYVEGLKLTSSKSVEIISYSIMPTHIHLTLKQLVDGGISKYMAKILNSYTRYFNIQHQRKGPLWEGKFQSVLVNDDDQLLHLTRYHHLNPVSAGLVTKPEDWTYSSYKEYLDDLEVDGFCDFKDLIVFNRDQYKKFVEDRIDYQKKLSEIKHLIFNDYSG